MNARVPEVPTELTVEQYAWLTGNVVGDFYVFPAEFACPSGGESFTDCLLCGEPCGIILRFGDFGFTIIYFPFCKNLFFKAIAF